jgi:TPR repeat protein
MSYSSDRLYRRIVFGITLVAFPIALLLFAFSSCEVRKRSEKQACRAGDVAQCLYVGKYYEDKQDGIIGFLMSNADTAIANYYQACKLKSPVGCDRMMYLLAHSDQAKNLSTELTDIADALIDACTARVRGACDQLWAYMNGSDWVANRSAAAFEVRCNGGIGEACYRLGRMRGQSLGGMQNVLPEMIRLYDKGCASGSQEACSGAKDYRAEQARRGIQAEAGSGADATIKPIPAHE